MTFTPHTLDPELDLELVRETDVAPELVWRAWTEPELLTQWFTPKPWETPVVEVDLRPGGKFHTVMRGPDGEENDNTGCFLEVIPNERLVWTGALGPGFRPQTGPLLFTAIVELQPNGSGGTHYRAIAMHLDPAMRKEHDEMGFSEGWGAVFDQLVELMRTQG
jgi:uncharacterized protein YndB with AHSA1/START domain